MSLRIKDLRTERHLTQQDVADGTSISRSVLSQYETGTVDPTASVISRLADYFQVSIDYLVGREDDLGNISLSSQSTPSRKEQELLAIFRQMTEAQQNRFLGIGEGMIEGATAVKRR